MDVCRQSFVFEDGGQHTINGRATHVFSYAQVAPCKVFQYSLSLPDWLAAGTQLHRGRLWLDAETARVLREERDLYIEVPAKPGNQVHMLHFQLDYAPSAFDVLVPTRIVMEVVRHSGQGVGVPTMRLTQHYGPFSRFAVKTEQKVVLPKPSE